MIKQKQTRVDLFLKGPQNLPSTQPPAVAWLGMYVWPTVRRCRGPQT
jgi:hypothetical protein